MLKIPMLKEVQTDHSPKATSLLLGTGNGIGAIVQPSITQHEVLLVGVGAGPVAVSGCLCCGQQGLIEQWIAINDTCWPRLGLHASYGTVLNVILSGVLQSGNGHGG
jgi:hypothetical protein